jgi:stress response protein YsnF
MTDSKQLIGTQMVGRDGEGIGAVERVFTKDSTGEPAWVTVRMGVMRREHVLPLDGAQMDADSIRVPYTQEMVKNSPKLEFDDHLGAEDISALSRYYGTTAQAAAKSASGAQMPAAGGRAGSRDEHDVKVPQDLHRDATLEAVRYGERLQVAKENREAGRVKLRTYVEQVAAEQKVELHHETFEVERVPVTDTAQFTREQPDWAEQVQEIVLFAERAHVSKEVVPLERIVVRKKMISEEQVVRDSLRTQQFEVIEPDVEADTSMRSGSREGSRETVNASVRNSAAAGTSAARGIDPDRR